VKLSGADERVTATLETFTTRESATEPLATVKVVEGEVMVRDSLVVKLRGAA
jgi:hypothetical protein